MPVCRVGSEIGLEYLFNQLRDIGTQSLRE